MKIVVDAHAWVEIFRGGDEGRSVADRLSKALEVYTPGTVLVEIALKYLREGLSADEARDRLNRITEASRVARIDLETALLSAEGDRELRHHAGSRGLDPPSLFDGIRRPGCKVLTGDKHFENLPETIMLGRNRLASR